MNILASTVKTRILKNDILALASKASSAKKQDPHVINAVAGVLMHDDGSFYCFKTVDDILKKCSAEELYTYSASGGSEEFQDAVCDWVFHEQYEEIKEKAGVKAIPTPGATGAIGIALSNALDRGEILLLPDIYWGPYKNMADAEGFLVVEYPYLKDGKFNFSGFKEAADKIGNRQKKVVTIINDPCHNPTGYSLTAEEFKQLIEYFNRNQDIAYNIIYDIAYFDYGEEEHKFSLMTDAKENTLFNIAFSCSKSFSLYGMRVGASIILSCNKKCVDELYLASTFLARARWSNVTKAGISLLLKLNKDKELQEKVKAELNDAKDAIKRRADVFIKEAREVDLPIYKYRGGFFIFVAGDGIKLAEKLIAKGIYVLGHKKGIRIAICGLSLNEVAGMARKIKDAIVSL